MRLAKERWWYEMLISWTMVFSISRTADERYSESRMRLMVSTHWTLSSVKKNLKVSHEARPQKNSEKGISRALSTVAYFLVPELTTPQKNMKMGGSSLAQSFPIHRDNHEISIQTNSMNKLGPLTVVLLGPV